MPWVTINGGHVLIGEDGNGSSAHAAGTHTGEFVSNHVTSGKHPAQMTPSEINKSLDKLDKQSSKINDQLIASGRGTEKFSESIGKSDPLATSRVAIERQSSALRDEIARRYGPGAPNRLPRGFKLIGK